MQSGLDFREFDSRILEDSASSHQVELHMELPNAVPEESVESVVLEVSAVPGKSADSLEKQASEVDLSPAVTKREKGSLRRNSDLSDKIVTAGVVLSVPSFPQISPLASFLRQLPCRSGSLHSEITFHDDDASEDPVEMMVTEAQSLHATPTAIATAPASRTVPNVYLGTMYGDDVAVELNNVRNGSMRYMQAVSIYGDEIILELEEQSQEQSERQNQEHNLDNFQKVEPEVPTRARVGLTCCRQM